MRFSRDYFAGNQVPIIKSVPVYDAAQLQHGELVMLGTTDPDSDNDGGVAFVTAFVSDSVAEAVDALGIINDRRGTTGFTAEGPNDPVTVSGAFDIATAPYLKAIVNPGAVYLAEYDQTDTLAVASTTTTTITITSLEDDIDTGWIFMVTATVSGNDANLRQLTASAAGSATMDSALTGGNETSGTAIKILPVNHRFVELTDDALGIGSDAAIATGVSLMVVENYLKDDGIPFQELSLANRVSHRGKDLSGNAKFFAELIMLDHVYNAQI